MSTENATSEVWPSPTGAAEEMLFRVIEFAWAAEKIWFTDLVDQVQARPE